MLKQTDIYSTERELSIDQGYVFDDVVRYPGFSERLPGIVVTPTCDFHQRDKKKYVTSAVVLPVLPIAVFAAAAAQKHSLPWSKTERRVIYAGVRKTKKGNFEGEVKNLIKGNIMPLHYLAVPPGKHKQSFAPFDRPIGLPFEELESKTFVAALKPLFREHFATRFCSYYLRVGTDDFGPEQLDAFREACAIVKKA